MIRMDPDGPRKGKQFSVQNFLVLNTVTPVMTSVGTVLTTMEPVLIVNRPLTRPSPCSLRSVTPVVTMPVRAVSIKMESPRTGSG